MGDICHKNAYAAYVALVCVSVALLLAMVAIYCWGLDRGLDLIDEGDFLLTSTNPLAYPQPSAYAFFMAYIPSPFGETLKSYRLASLIAELGSSLILSWSVARWVNRYVEIGERRWTTVAVTVVTLMASLLFSTIFATTIAYNIFAAYFLYLSTACVFSALTPGRRATTSSLPSNKFDFNQLFAPLMVASGFLLGFAFFAKFTSSVCVYLLTIPVLAFSLETKKIRAILLQLVGGALSCVFYFCAVENPTNFWNRLNVTVLDMELRSGSSHAPSQVFANSMSSAFKHLPELLGVALTLLVMPFAWLVLVKQQRRILVWIIPLAGLVAMIGLWLWRAIKQHELHSSLVYWPVVLVALTSLTCAAATGFRKTLLLSAESGAAKIRLVPAFALLALMPFALSFGTNAPLFWHALGNIAPLFLGIGYLSVMIGIELRSDFYPIASLSLMVLVLFTQFINGYMLHFKNGPSLASNTVTLSEPARVRNIKLEPALATFIGEGNAILRAHSFEDGDLVLGLYDLPGFVYAVGGTSPMFARYGAPFPVQNDYFLSRLPRKKWQGLFLIVNDSAGSSAPTQTVVSRLQEAGLNFPERFVPIGKVFRPNQYWNGGGSIAYFYALKPE